MSEPRRIPDWMLERFLLGELPRRQRRRIEEELERDPSLRAELERMRRDDREILRAYPADQVIPQILKRAALAGRERAAPRRRRLAWVAVPALALAVLLLVVLPPVLRRSLRPGDYVGTKGGGPQAAAPELRVFLDREGSGEPLRSGDRARAGDRLQLAYLPGKARYGVILSIDGNGGVTLHFPECRECSTALGAGRMAILPSSFELDSAPGFERFFFVTAAEPLPTALVLEQARILAAGDAPMSGRLDLPPRLGQADVLVRK